jgi:RNA methyltransferase, TrmH family
MPVRVVQSKQNARVKELRRALANPGREPLAAIEGPILLAEALRAGLRLRCVFAALGWERLLDTLPIPAETEVLLLPKPLLDSVLTTEAPQPAAALVHAPDWTWADLLGGHKSRAALILVLAGLQDPGNLGAILRSAEAFGATGVVSAPGTVSAWNPKAVRASAGSVFRVPLVAAGADECFTRLRRAGVKLWTSAAQGGKPACLANLAGPAALIIGNEGNGVPPELASKADGALTIPCPGAVESLNAAVAAGILLYEAWRQRSAPAGALPGHRGAKP